MRPAVGQSGAGSDSRKQLREEPTQQCTHAGAGSLLRMCLPFHFAAGRRSSWRRWGDATLGPATAEGAARWIPGASWRGRCGGRRQTPPGFSGGSAGLADATRRPRARTAGHHPTGFQSCCQLNPLRLKALRGRRELMPSNARDC